MVGGQTRSEGLPTDPIIAVGRGRDMFRRPAGVWLKINGTHLDTKF
jgi:hypothetical protein